MQLLSPQQRKIIEFLCTARGAVAVKEIAAQNLMTSQTASGQLDKLEEMAYIRKTAVGRESLYGLREPLLRMVVELKHGRGEPVRLIVDFLRRWYDRQERQKRLSLVSPQHPLTREYLVASLNLNSLHETPLIGTVLDSFQVAQCLKDKQLERACEIAAEIIEEKELPVMLSGDWLQYGYCLNETKQRTGFGIRW